MRVIGIREKIIWVAGIILVFVSCSACANKKSNMHEESLSETQIWYSVGKKAATESLNLIKDSGIVPDIENLIILTNSGYVEVGGGSTEAAIDGLASVTGVSRGSNTLIEIHTAIWSPLWFAVYDIKSGLCTYFQVDSNKVLSVSDPLAVMLVELFSHQAMENIKYDHIYAHAAYFESTFGSKPFGGNEFRIIAIANAVASGITGPLLRVLEFHDHFCPGILSGIIMSDYLKNNFPPEPGGEYFVHSIDPWCKEDALIVLLNATPGKKSYSVSYLTAEDKADWVQEIQDVSSIVFRQNPQSKIWEGLALAFHWPEINVPEFPDDSVKKLYRSLWFLDHIEAYEDFIQELKRFKLSEGLTPHDWVKKGHRIFNRLQFEEN